MGSWRYIPAAADQTEVSWRPKCPLCGHKSRPNSQIVKSSHKFHIRNFPLSRNKSTDFLGSKHQRLGRAADVSQLWSSSSLVALRLNRSKVTEDSGNASDIYDETYNSASTPTSSQNNIYEDIEGSQSSVGTTSNSLYFCISEGRRNQLKLHKNVDWDIVEVSNKDDKETTPTTIAKDDHENRNTEAMDSSSNNLINRKRLQLK